MERNGICAAERDWNRIWREANDALKPTWLFCLNIDRRFSKHWPSNPDSNSILNVIIFICFLKTWFIFISSSAWPCLLILLLLILWMLSGVCPAVFIATWSSGKPFRTFLCVDSTLPPPHPPPKKKNKHFSVSKTNNLQRCECSFYQSLLDSCSCRESHFLNFILAEKYYFFVGAQSGFSEEKGPNAAD